MESLHSGGAGRGWGGEVAGRGGSVSAAAAACPHAVRGVYEATALLGSETVLRVVSAQADGTFKTLSEDPYNSQGSFVYLRPHYDVLGCSVEGTARYATTVTVLGCKSYTGPTTPPSAGACSATSGCHLNEDAACAPCLVKVLEGVRATFDVSSQGMVEQGSLLLRPTTLDKATTAPTTLQALITSCVDKASSADAASVETQEASLRSLFELLADQASQRCIL
ncbi:hypothetical protein HYH03_004554 [Edaphochlamys debaryana]|uniref:Uncharacterized protein n=1 Tax=Edaphochlamys debaryana TaxID=47281 RepID=A0A835Y939_9CHLO|nr:hypothetical protein HYH03_004554 [Edaphochlamys debaryana]|eukprot:KAG2497399.1 hypothetical protein HYH03_004554 [Edaphochlamys debaryana]